jgi:hypothetical protein
MLNESEFRSIDFGNEAGDDIPPEELKPYFVEQPAFKKYLDLNEKLIVATAKKGVGKSALIQWLSLPEHYDTEKVLIVKIRGADISRDRLGLTSTLTSPNDHIADWMKRVATIVNREIGKQIKMAFTDDAMSIVETAELDGFRERSFIRALTDRLKKKFENVRNRLTKHGRGKPMRQ